MEIKTWRIAAFRLVPLPKWVWAVAGFVFFWLLNFLPPLSPFERAKTAVSFRPDDPAVHLFLSEAAVGAMDWEIAQEEFEHSVWLVSQPRAVKVFGITSRFEEMRSRVYTEQRIVEEINRLRAVLEQYPGYRDVYLRLALLSFQLSDVSGASVFWMAAQELDPNSVAVQQIGTLLREGN